MRGEKLRAKKFSTKSWSYIYKIGDDVACGMSSCEKDMARILISCGKKGPKVVNFIIFLILGQKKLNPGTR
jgi:hypothetical protein